ncbi:MAG: hypothetical protein ACT4RN_20800 [Pseudonocardia sp.]
MTAPTDQFVDIAKRSQEAVTAAVRTWTDAVQGFTGTFGAAPKLPDAQAVVGQYFDFAQQVLETQRSFTLSVLSAGTQAAENVTEQANRVAENVKAHTLHATEATSEQATQAARNAKAAAAKN